MTKEQEVVEKLLSFAFAMSENMIGLTKGNYDEKTFVKKTYEYLQKYTVDRNEQKTIKQALNRLEEMDTANPNDVLECLEYLYSNPEDYRSNDRAKDYNTVKNYLLKAQEEHRALETLKKNRIDIESFYTTFIENDYNYQFYEISYGTYGKYKLTEEEFNSVKETLE